MTAGKVHELVRIEQVPPVPPDWDYAASVKKTKRMVYKWKNVTVELATELQIARDALSTGGRPRTGRQSWQSYCAAIGVDRATVHRWLARCFPKSVANATVSRDALPLPETVALDISDYESDEGIVSIPESVLLAKARKVKTRRRKQREQKRAEDRARAVAEKHPLKGEGYRLVVGDCAQVLSDVQDATVDAIITDPPYGREFLPEYEKLAVLALRVLVDGGHCLVMSGQANLPEVCAILSAAGLTYVWTLCYHTPGESTQVFGRDVKSNWKPVLWYGKGKAEIEDLADVVSSDMNDKRFHKWGQSVGGMGQIVERFTVPKALILDPFCGGGATGVAAVAMDRLFVGCDRDVPSVQTSAKRLRKVVSCGVS